MSRRLVIAWMVIEGASILAFLWAVYASGGGVVGYLCVALLLETRLLRARIARLTRDIERLSWRVLRDNADAVREQR